MKNIKRPCLRPSLMLFVLSVTRLVFAVDAAQLTHLEKKLRNCSTTLKPYDEWIIGESNPDEVVEITTPFRYVGDITIVNNGRLYVHDTDFTLNGDLVIWGNGEARFTNTNLLIEQEYIYEHDALVLMNGKLYFDNVDFRSSNQSWSVGLAGGAFYSLVHSRISEGFITTAALDSATIHVEDTERPGEFLCFGDNELDFSNSDFLLFWIVTPESSELDISLPSDSLLTDWTFPEHAAVVSGIPYRVKIDSCTQVLWGLISQSGSNAIFRDTHFRVAGLFFLPPDSITVQNLTNGSSHADDYIVSKDRSLRFINNKVDTWNFYTAQEAKLTIDKCIFGEVLSMDSSRVNVFDSVCDGSGGYMGARDKSFLLAFGSLIKSQVIARNNGVLICSNSAILGPEIDADEQAIMFFANTTYTAKPQAHQAAAFFEAQLPPVDAKINEIVPLVGTARLLAGPDNPITFTGYQVEYKPQDGQYLPAGEKQTAPVYNDLLAEWNTHGLSTGAYPLRLTLYHSYGDSISMESYAQLALNTRAEIYSPPQSASLLGNYPNPFNPTTTIAYELHITGNVKLIIYNALGRIVTKPVDGQQSSGHHTVQIDASNWPAGAYYYQLQTEYKTDIRRMLLIK